MIIMILLRCHTRNHVRGISRVQCDTMRTPPSQNKHFTCSYLSPPQLALQTSLQVMPGRSRPGVGTALLSPNGSSSSSSSSTGVGALCLLEKAGGGGMPILLGRGGLGGASSCRDRPRRSSAASDAPPDPEAGCGRMASAGACSQASLSLSSSTLRSMISYAVRAFTSSSLALTKLPIHSSDSTCWM